MKARVLLLAAVLVTTFSCKKSNENETLTPPPDADGQSVTVQLKLTGDITTTESPLGRKTDGVAEHAKTIYDSTIYAIIVRKNGQALYEGIFNRTDSMFLKIPGSGTITVSAVAVKKGTGGGLSFTQHSGNTWFGVPFRGALTNRMDTVIGYPVSTDTLSYINLVDPLNPPSGLTSFISEADSYVGKVTFAASATPSLINVPMKRVVFGIKYNVTNLSAGKLRALYSDMFPVSLTAAEAASRQFIYTADELQYRDSLYLRPLNVTLSWEKPDGSSIPLGSKTIAFKRNILTTINVTIPSTGGVVNPVPTDTIFTGNESVNF